MIEHGGLGGATGGMENNRPIPMSTGGEPSGRRGGLGVWYQTKGELTVKGEETDFIATTPLPRPVVPPHSGSLRPSLANLVYSIPTDVLNDITEENRNFPIRHTLLMKHGRVRMLTTTRDSHVYFFPYWVLEMIKKNEKFDSLSDALGWWAKAGWQKGLGEKLGLRDILHPMDLEGAEDGMAASGILQDEVDIANLSTTFRNKENTSESKPVFASRVVDSDSPSVQVTIPEAESPIEVPAIHAYVQSSDPSAPFIRRVDTAALLLNVSLRLAKLPSVEEIGRNAASPFAHPAKVAHPDSVPKRCRVEAENSLVAENVIIEEKCNIKESVIGANCKIASGARLQRCLLMDGAEVGENCQLTGCILGRRCKIEGGPAKADDKTVLKDCEVQEGFVVEWGSEYSRDPSVLSRYANSAHRGMEGREVQAVWWGSG